MPTTTSAPISPGGLSSVSASRSVATATSAPRSCARVDERRPGRGPRRTSPGYCSSTPKHVAVGQAAAREVGRRRRSMPSGSARVRSTASVCGSTSASTRNRCDARRPAAAQQRHRLGRGGAPRRAGCALAVGRPVRSATTVWKLSSASSRPWLISGWYGVYAVYQPGSSSTLRRIDRRGDACRSSRARSSRSSTRLRPASSRSSASTSCSVAGGGRASGPSSRIEAGIAASVSASSDGVAERRRASGCVVGGRPDVAVDEGGRPVGAEPGRRRARS